MRGRVHTVVGTQKCTAVVECFGAERFEDLSRGHWKDHVQDHDEVATRFRERSLVASLLGRELFDAVAEEEEVSLTVSVSLRLCLCLCLSPFLSLLLPAPLCLCPVCGRCRR